MAKSKPRLIVKLNATDRKLLTEARIERHLTYPQLLVRVGMTKERLLALESGKSDPTVTELVRWTSPLDFRVAATEVAIVKRAT